MRDTMKLDLLTSALRVNREARQPAPGVLFHGATMELELAMTRDCYTRE